jgi:hypothetical protein
MTPDELDALTRRPTGGPYRATVVVAGAEVATLADIPPERDRLLFVGLESAAVSIEAGHYHQDRAGHTLWRRLMLAGVLPKATPVDTADDALLGAGHGMTDLSKVPSSGGRPDPDVLRAGVGPLWQKIALWRPAAVVFTDKRAAVACAGRDLAAHYGQLDDMAMAGRPCVLMPSPHATAEQVDEGLNFLRNLISSLPVDRP